jgi:hypothetical protein
MRGDSLMSKFPHVGSQPFISFLLFTVHSNKKKLDGGGLNCTPAIQFGHERICSPIL